MMKRPPVIVIKLGTSSIVHETTHQPLLSTLALIVETAVILRRNGCKVVIVSSGAIGISLHKMGLEKRPKHLPKVQALAAIGQCRLMGLWEEMFERLDQVIAQILLTRNDISDRTQYLNAQNTIVELLNMGVIPIVNENDTIAVTEIKFGDNDTLSAITAGMVSADYLFLMTDVDCLYDKNPRTNSDARPIEVVEDISKLNVDVSSAGSLLGTGGMSTKIIAARLATAAGVTTIITRSSRPGNIASIVDFLEAKKAASKLSAASPVTESKETMSVNSTPSPPLHTRFLPIRRRIRDRHFWLLHGLNPHGIIWVDHGAARALSEGRGLLAVGIIDVSGYFAQQECVRIIEVSRDETNILKSSGTEPAHVSNSSSREEREIGRALVNFSAIETKRIAGLQSSEIHGVLGYADTEYVAFRENVALFLDVKSGIAMQERAIQGDNSTGPSTPIPGTPITGRLAMSKTGGYVENKSSP